MPQKGMKTVVIEYVMHEYCECDRVSLFIQKIDDRNKHYLFTIDWDLVLSRGNTEEYRSFLVEQFGSEDPDEWVGKELKLKCVEYGNSNDFCIPRLNSIANLVYADHPWRRHLNDPSRKNDF